MSVREMVSGHEVRAVVNRLRGRHIKLKRDRIFGRKIDQLLDCDADGRPLPKPVEFTSTGETRGIVVTDGAGGGKTSLVRQALKEHPALQPTGAKLRPCVSISVPSPATMKSVGREILRASGYPMMAANRPAWDIWNAVRTKFEQLGVVVLWIDEAHDLFRSRSQSEAADILKTLKSLMQGENAVIVVLSGIESLWQDISFDPQVKRRYSRFELPPLTTAADAALLRQVLARFCEEADIEEPPRGDLAERLIHAGRHRFGRCVEYMIDAIEVALMDGERRLEHRHFADAFFAKEGCTTDANVFLTPRWAELEVV